MFYYAVVFFVVALIAAVFGFGGLAAGLVGTAKYFHWFYEDGQPNLTATGDDTTGTAGAAGIAKILFVLFLIGAVVTFFISLSRRA